MALIWADFPSGQKGLYGTNTSWMFNGIWTALDGNFSEDFFELTDDPDPNIGSLGKVIRFDRRSSTGAFDTSRLRMALGSAKTTVGVGCRVWMSELPRIGTVDSTDNNPLISFRTAANVRIAEVYIGPSGQVQVYNSADVLLGESATFPFTANAWKHWEVKCTRDAAAGTFEVRVDGATVLSLTGLALGANDIGAVCIGQRKSEASVGNEPFVYYKDFFVYDSTGTEVNDFQGSIAVYDLVTDGDDTLTWTTSSGATGYNLINDNVPSNLLTASGIISNNEQVRIGDIYYKFTSGSVDAGTPAGTSGSPWLVALGGDTATSIANLYNAINASGTPGTTYSTGLTIHPTVSAVGYSTTALNIKCNDGLTENITCTETGANLSWTGSTLTGGPTDLSYISADDTPPAPSIFTMTNLPPDITSVRAVIPIGRMVKTDGGDCNIQMSVSPDGTNWDAGADRAITTAYTWWWDISEVSPATATRWTPTEVNNLKFRIDRTL